MAMVNSLDPCAMAMILMFWREIAVKILPARPGVPRIPSPTTAISPTLRFTSTGFKYPCANSSDRLSSRDSVTRSSSDCRTRKQKFWR